MSDFFVQLSMNPMARKAVKTLRLPVPVPPILRRERGPWEERPLNDLPIVVSHGTKGGLAQEMSRALVDSGAEIWLLGDNRPMQAYKEAGEAWSRVAKILSLPAPETLKPHGLIWDATGIQGPEDIKEGYAFFHALIRSVRSCGRCLVIARPVDAAPSPEAAAARRGLEGFIRSIAKEIGRKGSTAQILYLEEGADHRLGAVLRFFLSGRSSYISGQPLRVSKTVQDGNQAPPFVKPLEGKVALVTGAARGIGAATAQALAREGAHVIVMDLASAEVEARALADRLKGTALVCDMTSGNAGEIIVSQIRQRSTALDILIHNAGITRDKTLGNMDDDRWNQVLEVNLQSILRANQTLIPVLREGGRMVCLSSVMGIAGNFGQTNYATTKAGLIGYVQALAPSLAGRGITVNAVAPGFIETRMTASIPLITRQVGRRLSNLDQGGLPEDVAEAIAFLASPGAVGVTGQVLRICGGSLIGA